MDLSFERVYEAIDGPSIGSIIDSFKYAFHPRTHINLDFEIIAVKKKDGGYIPLKIRHISITSLEYEGSNGDKLHLRGDCEADLRPISYAPKFIPYKFSAIFDTKKRKGSFIFFEE